MTSPERDLSVLLSRLEPVLNEGIYVFAVMPASSDANALRALASFREPEGLTLILEEQVALAAELPVLFRAAWITLKVHSALEAIGLTSAVSQVLSDAGISCNIVAAAHHDHLFVPWERAQDALRALQALQQRNLSPPR